MNKEDELRKLQNELRGVKIQELSQEQFEIYKKKSERVHELMNELYNFN